jgi:hypothetical protein
MWEDVRKAAGLLDVPVHDLRHSLYEHWAGALLMPEHQNGGNIWYFGFARGLAKGLPRHPQKGAARNISQGHPIRIFEGRPRRTCTLLFSLFFESPLMVRPSRAFEYLVHPFQ